MQTPANPYIAGLTAGGILMAITGLVIWSTNNATYGANAAAQNLGLAIGVAGMIFLGLAVFAGALSWKPQGGTVSQPSTDAERMRPQGQ